jgi:hypothetical protein
MLPIFSVETIMMNVFHQHIWLFSSTSALLGIAGYLLLVRVLCRILALAQREDHKRASIYALADASLEIAGGSSDDADSAEKATSDSPALSEMLANLGTAFKTGETVCIPNAPHSPLLLELREPAVTNQPRQLIAYHSRMAEIPYFRDCEMTFDVIESNGAFRLKCVDYQSVKPEYLGAFATMWSDELERQGYVEAQRTMMSSNVKDEPPTVSFHIGPMMTADSQITRMN